MQKTEHSSDRTLFHWAPPLTTDTHNCPGVAMPMRCISILLITTKVVVGFLGSFFGHMTDSPTDRPPPPVTRRWVDGWMGYIDVEVIWEARMKRKQALLSFGYHGDPRWRKKTRPQMQWVTSSYWLLFGLDNANKLLPLVIISNIIVSQGVYFFLVSILPLKIKLTWLV